MSSFPPFMLQFRPPSGYQTEITLKWQSNACCELYFSQLNPYISARDKSDRKTETLDLHNQTCCFQSAMKAANAAGKETYAQLQCMSNKKHTVVMCACVLGKKTDYSICMQY